MGKFVETASDFYSELNRRGLEIRKAEGRDNGLFFELCRGLGCIDGRLKAHLETTQISAVDFLKVFLKVAEPFACMYKDIWNYLSKYCAPRSGEHISIRFGWPGEAGIQDIDLEQFRRHVQQWEEVAQVVQSGEWTVELMNRLFGLASFLPANFDADVESTGYNKGQKLVLPELKLSGHPIDELLKDIRSLFQQIINDYSILPQEIAENHPILAEKAQILTDLIPSWARIFQVVDRINDSNLDQAMSYFENEIKPYFHLNLEKLQQLVNTATDIMDLPFWKHRWHTYEIWCTVLVLNTIADLEPQPLVSNGRLAIDGYSSNIIANLANASYPRSCIMVQEETPVVLGKKKAMKPDLRVCFDQLKGVVENTAAVIEFKQQSAIKKEHIQEISYRYTLGAPRSGGVVILNYDHTGISPKLAQNAYYFERSRPLQFDMLESFTRSLKMVLTRAGLVPSEHVLLLDVSSSMNGMYDGMLTLFTLDQCIKSDRVDVLFFNEALVEGELGYNGKPRTYGGTDLVNALSQLRDAKPNLKNLLIISDGDYHLPFNILDGVNFRECTPDELRLHLDWILRQ